MRPFVLCSAHSPPRSRRRAVCCSKDTWYILCVCFLGGFFCWDGSQRGRSACIRFQMPPQLQRTAFFLLLLCSSCDLQKRSRWMLKTVILIHVKGYSLKRGCAEMQKVIHSLTFCSFCLQILQCTPDTREIHWFSPTNQQGLHLHYEPLSSLLNWI